MAPEPLPEAPRPDPEIRGVFTPSLFNPYFRGNFYAALAIQKRVSDAQARKEAKAHRSMAESFLAAWKEWRPKVD